MTPVSPTHIFIDDDEAVRESAVTGRFIRAFPAAERCIVRTRADIDAVLPPTPERAKSAVFLTKNRGAFVRRCPGTKHFVCCDYRIIDAVSQCPFDCAYCFLSAYDNAFITEVSVNIDDMVRDAANAVGADEFVRLGTGELADSLVYDEVSGISEALIPLLESRPRLFLELKTKSDSVRHIIRVKRPHAHRIVMAFSMNPDVMIRRFERGSASLSKRLRAAAASAKAGYSVAFHFDPLIRHDGWQKNYLETVDAIYDVMPRESIAWISMGGLRYPKALKDHLIAARPGDLSLLADDFTLSDDGKFRYFRPLREEMYRTIHTRIRKYDRAVYVYLCMETPAMWRSVFGRDFSIHDLEHALTSRSGVQS